MHDITSNILCNLACDVRSFIHSSIFSFIKVIALKRNKLSFIHSFIQLKQGEINLAQYKIKFSADCGLGFIKHVQWESEYRTSD